MELEKKAEDVGLYHFSEEENENLKRNLSARMDVKQIIEECQKFHKHLECENSLYHKADGTCNNLKHPRWGSSNIANDRFLPASFEGIRRFRKSANGQDLPKPRAISLQMTNKTVPSKQVSSFFTFFGQTVTHDVTLAAGTSRNGITYPCCPYQPGNVEKSPICINIHFSPDDPFYGKFNYSCFPFARTAVYPSCNFDKRTPLNKKTAYVDASIIYGNSDEEEKQLRASDNSGKLAVQDSPFGYLLPKNENEEELFCKINKTKECFLAGDERINQHTLNIALQTMLVRLHNIIAVNLRKLNPHWTSDKIYFESRRLVIAEYQYMTYSEYLPLLVGQENMKKYNLTVNTNQGSLYDEEVSASLLVEFSTAAFRLHSMVPTTISKFHPRTRMDLSFSYTKPLHQGKLDSFVQGSCEVPSEKNDKYVKEDVSDFLYRPRGASFGFDLVSANIQRGRDHGIPIYIDVVEKCSHGAIKVRQFSDLIKIVSKEDIEWLKRIYSNVSDVDLWVGMMIETPLTDAVTGPTAACISAIQFHRAKFGDTFFFSHVNGRYPFTQEQLQFIEAYPLARWICDTTNLLEIRRHPLQLPGLKNPMIPCTSFQSMDLSAWKESTTDN